MTGWNGMYITLGNTETDKTPPLPRDVLRGGVRDHIAEHATVTEKDVSKDDLEKAVEALDDE